MEILSRAQSLKNLSPAALVEKTILERQGKLSSSGALVVNTGNFTGRSPKDRFIVKDDVTKDSVDWGDINIPIDQQYFEHLRDQMLQYANQLEVYYERDVYACANPNYKLKVRVFTEYAWQNMFAYNMFLRPLKKDLEDFDPDWTVYAFPGVTADPSTDGTRQENFSIINFTERTIIIGGTAYTGEIKKGIFSALNYLFHTANSVLTMHCSANVRAKRETAVCFRLSGTGKPSSATDPTSRLRSESAPEVT